jgi:HEAT repeat protein
MIDSPFDSAVHTAEEVERLQKLPSQLADFSLHLIQAVLRTGPYASDHPVSRLYLEFQKLMAQDQEITFLLRREQDGQTVFVEGVGSEPQSLARILSRDGGELFVPRFARYLERKDLVSLTLKNRMDESEFVRFIELMNDPAYADTRRAEDKERFSTSIFIKGISNVSFIFDEEILGTDREMPWRARLILSRIGKDLKMLPLFRKVSAPQIQKIGMRLMRDAFLSIRQSEILYAILQNADLAASAENGQEDIEEAIISTLRKQSLVGVSRIFLRTRAERKEGEEETGKSARLMKRITCRLIEDSPDQAASLLEEFYRRGLIALDDLPVRVREKILAERLTDKFLAYFEQFFDQIDRTQEKERFLNLAGSFVKILPELIHRDRYPEILRIVEVLKAHFHQKRMWALLAGRILEEIGSGPIPILLKEKFVSEKKEVRTAIVPIFASLEIGAVPHLIDILKKSEDQWVRKNACEALVMIGPVATIHLLEILKQDKMSTESRCEILKVLSQIKDPEWKAPLIEMLGRYLSHEDPRIREQALHTRWHIDGAGSEDVFLSCLADSALEVRKRAVWCLGAIKSVKGAEKMIDLLSGAASLPLPERDLLEAEIYHALGLTGNLTISNRTVEETLIEALERRAPRRWLGLFQKSPATDSCLSAICDALGNIGTAASLKALARWEKPREGVSTAKVKRAIRKIEDRLSGVRELGRG